MRLFSPNNFACSAEKALRYGRLRLEIVLADDDRLNKNVGIAPAKRGGAAHNFALFKEGGLNPPPHVLPPVDAGGQGAVEIHLNILIFIMKTKLLPLSKEQKIANQTLPRKCLPIEHIFRPLKIFRVLTGRHRNRRRYFRLRFSLTAAIHDMESKADGG